MPFDPAQTLCDQTDRLVALGYPTLAGLDEGIALVTQVPEILEKNKCFMISGSRRHDRRVPARMATRRSSIVGLAHGRQKGFDRPD